MGSVAMPYPAEYLKSSPDEEQLKQLATISGGIDQAKPKQVYDNQGMVEKFHKDLWPYVLMAVACAFMIDLYLRRVRIFGYRAIKF